MLERYSITATQTELATRFSIDVPAPYKPRFNAAPSQLLPVITHQSPSGISFFYWGMAPEWSKNKAISERIVNVRGEQLPEKPVARKNLMKRRCLVPADGFYHWKRIGKKTAVPYRYTLSGKEIFSFPALWEEFDDEQGNFYHTFSIITLPRAEDTQTIPDRWPVILTPEQEKIWLSKESKEEELLSFIKPISMELLNGYTVSPRINSLQEDGPTLIIPMPPADQHGNLTLFD